MADAGRQIQVGTTSGEKSEGQQLCREMNAKESKFSLLPCHGAKDVYSSLVLELVFFNTKENFLPLNFNVMGHADNRWKFIFNRTRRLLNVPPKTKDDSLYMINILGNI